MTVGRGSKHWNKGMVHWVDHDTMTAFISVAFSWMLPEAYSQAYWYGLEGFKVRAGGPATFTNREYLSEVAEVGGDVKALQFHSPYATFASKGCPIGCSWCLVTPMEGKEFTLLSDFIPKPILCDSNVSALPVDYQEYIIDKYNKSGVELIDINSGFEPHSFNKETYKRWKGIYSGKNVMWRFAFDEESEEKEAKKMSVILKDENSRNKRVYVLIGNEPFESCYRRVIRVIEWGCEPFVKAMYALNTLEKTPIVRYDWTEQKLKDLSRWANRWMWKNVPFEEYNRFITIKKTKSSINYFVQSEMFE